VTFCESHTSMRYTHSALLQHNHTHRTPCAVQWNARK
jgi:hypothetical protein